MVERFRRGKGKRKLLGSHQRCWIWGRNVVLETLRAARWPVLELHLAEDRLASDVLDEARTLAERAGVPVSVETAEELSRRCRSSEHQGCLAKMPPFPYDDPDAVLAERPPRPLYAVLDALQDPYNFGAVLRSAEVLGLDAVFVGAERQVEVTSLVARSSAGAVNHVRLARAPDLAELARRLQSLKVRLVAASEKAETPLFACDFRGPTALVIGNEGTGIRDELLALCDERVTIPQSGHIGSLNAAVSAGIVFYEAVRQRTGGDASRESQPRRGGGM